MSQLSLVRSGLMTCQLLPPFVVLNKTLPAKYNVFLSIGEKSTGAVLKKRYLPLRTDSGEISWTCPVRLSNFEIATINNIGIKGIGRHIAILLHTNRVPLMESYLSIIA